MNVTFLLDSLVREKLSDKFNLARSGSVDTNLDSLRSNLIRAIDIFYTKRVSEYDLKPCWQNFHKGELGLSLVVDWEIRSDQFMKTLVTPNGRYHSDIKCRTLAHIFLFDLNTGEIVFYRYNFKEFPQEYKEHTSYKHPVRSESYVSTWNKIIDKELSVLIRNSSKKIE